MVEKGKDLIENTYQYLLKIINSEGKSRYFYDQQEVDTFMEKHKDDLVPTNFEDVYEMDTPTEGYTDEDIIENLKESGVYDGLMEAGRSEGWFTNDKELVDYIMKDYNAQPGETFADVAMRTGAFNELVDGYHPDSFEELDTLSEDVDDDLDMALVNPSINEPPGEDYDGDGIQDEFDTYGYRNNCAYCTLAYEMRQRGYDIEAASVGPLTNNTIEEIESWYQDGKFHEFSSDTSWRAVEAAILKDTNSKNARGQLCVYWGVGGGHSMVYEVRQGTVYIRDCQRNTEWKMKDFPHVAFVAESFFMRTDNLELTEKALVGVRNRKEDD